MLGRCSTAKADLSLAEVIQATQIRDMCLMQILPPSRPSLKFLGLELLRAEPDVLKKAILPLPAGSHAGAMQRRPNFAPTARCRRTVGSVSLQR